MLDTLTGGAEDKLAGKSKGLDEVIKKKKVATQHMNPKLLFSGQVSFR